MSVSFVCLFSFFFFFLVSCLVGVSFNVLGPSKHQLSRIQ